MTPTGLWRAGEMNMDIQGQTEEKRLYIVQNIKLHPAVRVGEQVAHHMSVAVEMGVWLTISGATYSAVPYLQ